MLHLILTGHPQSGKSHIAGTISQLHKRALIKMDELIQWVIESGSELGAKLRNTSKTEENNSSLLFNKDKKLSKKLVKKLNNFNRNLVHQTKRYMIIFLNISGLKHKRKNKTS
jgi:dephospho-CoA kinase